MYFAVIHGLLVCLISFCLLTSICSAVLRAHLVLFFFSILTSLALSFLLIISNAFKKYFLNIMLLKVDRELHLYFEDCKKAGIE